MKENKKTIILTSLICLLPILAGILLYPQLPDEIATHWGMDGTPNGWSSKFTGAILFPGILFLVNLAMPFIAKADPKYKNIDSKLMKITFWIIPFVSVICSAATLSYAMGHDIKIESIMPALLGVLFIVIGNYLPKTKQSYTMGIKLPWTLNSEENWNKTHRMAGYLWVIAGFVCIVCAVFRGPFIIYGIVLGAAVLIPAGYSFCLCKKGI